MDYTPFHLEYSKQIFRLCRLYTDEPVEEKKLEQWQIKSDPSPEVEGMHWRKFLFDRYGEVESTIQSVTDQMSKINMLPVIVYSEIVAKMVTRDYR